MFKFLDDLTSGLLQKFPAAAAPAGWRVSAERCPENMAGELTVNAFKFARIIKVAPDQAAAATAEILAAHPDVAAVETVKAFVNVTLKSGALFRDTLSDVPGLFAAGRTASPRRYLIEYSAPNTNKPQHLGHVRNNTLGMSVASMLKRVGNEVIQVNLVNDRGIHICKSMIAYQRFGNAVTPESVGKKGDHLVGDFYVKYNAALSEELAEMRAGHPEWTEKSDEELFLETGIGRAAQQMLQDWEAGKPEVIELWKMMNGWVFDGFAETYRTMGIEFDRTYLESQTYLLGKDIVKQGLDSGAFTRRDDGAVVCDLGPKLGVKVLLRADGTSVYITQDLGTTLKKYADYQPDSMIWVVGDEQIWHFQVLFALLKKLGCAWADKLHHLAYGMVNLPTGRMKSREGTVVDADNLFEEMTELALAACRERNTDGIADDELLARARVIAMGALKFMLLKFNPKTTIMFDPAASIRFEGDTGPYVQYACARIGSILRKAGDPDTSGADWSLLETAEEKNLALWAAFYSAVLEQAAERLDCSGLVEYLLNVAKAFNQFYRECPVLSDGVPPELRKARLALAKSVRALLEDGLHTLTIDVPDAM
ncbi:MAG: arginine--tRNA ligase [Victivallaceae bacterium]|nr:arginine--tRNA ligase [Victivallaceae bacterium]